MSAGRDSWSVGRVVAKIRHVARHQRTVSLRPTGTPRGNVLISYVHEPFLRTGEPLPSSHTHFWESVQVVLTYLRAGYAVDVISYHNRTFRPRKRYEILVDPRWNLERLAARLNEDCIRVMHADTAHITYQNAAECRRLLEVQQRRGVTLQPRRYERPNLGIEYADCAIVLGNGFTQSTYAYAGKPMHHVPVSVTNAFDFPTTRDFATARKRFVWLGSGGAILKGLDLALEVFARCPDLHLTVCGPTDREPDFVNAYAHELRDLPNIDSLGWVDLGSAEFRQVLRTSAAIVYPSASEGGGGAVIQAMHGGLIPICSREASVDVPRGVGVLLADSSLDTIESAVRGIAESDPADLEETARAAWERARRRHSREAFAARYREVATELLDGDRRDVLVRPLGPRPHASS